MRLLALAATGLLLLLVLGYDGRSHGADGQTSRAPRDYNLTQRLATPYALTREECYGAICRTRNHTLAVVALLPPLLGGDERGLLRSMQNLLSNNPADVIFFHTNSWRKEDLGSVGFDFQLACVATADWLPPRNFHAWEHSRFCEECGEKSGLQLPGYRSMCRWYSKRVSGWLGRGWASGRCVHGMINVQQKVLLGLLHIYVSFFRCHASFEPLWGM